MSLRQRATAELAMELTGINPCGTADATPQPEEFPEAKLANEFARRLIAGHAVDWTPHRPVPRAIQPLAQALDEGRLTPAQARQLLAEVWREVSGEPLPVSADSAPLPAALARDLRRAELRRVASSHPARRVAI